MKQDFDILIVEDEPVVIQSADRILAEEGIRIDTCSEVSQALEKLTQHRYKLIITDLMLPNVSGLQFLQQVRREHPDLPVIIITGYATLESSLRSYRLGACDFIPKPFEIEEFQASVYRCLHPGPKMTDCVPESDTNRAAHAIFEAEYYQLGWHSWAKPQKEAFLIGLGRTFSGLQGELSELELPPVNSIVKQGDVCARLIDKRQYVHKVCSPLSGRVLETTDRTVFLNSTTLLSSWLLRLQPENPAQEVSSLTHISG